MGRFGRRIVLIVGLPGSGKDAAAKAIEEELGFRVLRMSDELLDELKRRGLPVTRENMRKVGMELRDEMGPSAIAKLVIRRMEDLGDEGGFVINGIRNLEEIEEFERRFGDEVITIAILASKRLRFLRQLKRRRAGFDKEGYEEFLAEDREEIRTFHLGDAIAAADHFIVNEGSLEDLKWKIVGLLLATG